MHILCHRGFWVDTKEQNAVASFQKAISNKFGFESDIRDNNGKLVISHDMANANSSPADIVFDLLAAAKNEFSFAINIKADGLGGLLREALVKRNINNYFTFDMSVPQMLEYRELGIKYFTRQSEYEKEPCLYDDAAGVWIDAFVDDDWIKADMLLKHLNCGKKICIVSPELHGRDAYALWNKLINIDCVGDDVYLCTDYPQEADDFFNKKKVHHEN